LSELLSFEQMFFLLNDTSKSSGSYDYSIFNHTNKNPDLKVNSVTPSTGDVIEGDVITITVNVTNEGIFDSDNFTVELNITQWNGTDWV